MYSPVSTAPCSVPFFFSLFFGVSFVLETNSVGMNDGGKYQANREELQEAYLQFLDIPEDSPRRTTRHGVYSSHVFGIPEKADENEFENAEAGGNREGENEKKKKKFKKGTEVKVILLDTRRERDNHLIPSAGMESAHQLFSLSSNSLCRDFSLSFLSSLTLLFSLLSNEFS